MSDKERDLRAELTTDSITRMTNLGMLWGGLARALGQSVWKNIDLLNTKPDAWRPDLETDTMQLAETNVHRITPFCLSWLLVGVPKEYSHLAGSKAWLEHASHAYLSLQRSRDELPADSNGRVEGEQLQSETEIILEPATNADDAKPCRDRLYMATYRAGVPFNADETQLIIDILNQMAGESPTQNA